ncbi:MAG: DUF167 domain-containing protein [Candidatus Liptonbacteria bacterium]
MRIKVRIKPSSRVEEVAELPGGALKISVREPAREGGANEAVVRAVATHFKTPPSRVKIIRGHKGRNKILEVV